MLRGSPIYCYSKFKQPIALQFDHYCTLLQGFTKETFPDWVNLFTFFALHQPTSGRGEYTTTKFNKTWEVFFNEALCLLLISMLITLITHLKRSSSLHWQIKLGTCDQLSICSCPTSVKTSYSPTAGPSLLAGLWNFAGFTMNSPDPNAVPDPAAYSPPHSPSTSNTKIEEDQVSAVKNREIRQAITFFLMFSCNFETARPPCYCIYLQGDTSGR